MASETVEKNIAIRANKLAKTLDIVPTTDAVSLILILYPSQGRRRRVGAWVEACARVKCVDDVSVLGDRGLV